MPDPAYGGSDSVYVGVELSTYAANPLAEPWPDTFTFSSGTCPQLSGYVVGISDLSWDTTNGGWTTTTPFTGTLTNIGMQGLCVPEPMTCAFFALTGIGIVVSRIRRTSGPQANAHSRTRHG
jgi:hypothetical protein